MRRLTLLFAATLLAVTASAQEEAGKPLDAKLEQSVRALAPNCAGLTLTQTDLPFRLPTRFTGAVVRLQTAPDADGHRHGICNTQLAVVTSPTGGIFIGMPWSLANEEGATIEEKIKNFAWRNLQENVTPVIDRTRTLDGLYKVTLQQQTANGKMALDGTIDPEGTVLFMGHFRRGDLRADRAKAFDAIVTGSPQRGPKDAAVTVIEFSDFECPSCKYAAGYLDPILDKHGSKVRYVRYDVPLSGHPWAFSAAVAGRAIYKQKPDAFWAYKKEIYANQDKLSTFTFDDFARGFAQQHELDLKQYDADLASESVRNDILKGVGIAFSNDVRATPSYLVNGVFVDAGDDGKGLAAYVDSLIK